MRTIYAHFDRDDFEGISRYMHPDIEWHSSGVFPGLDPVYRGLEDVRRWWHAVREPFEEFKVELERVWDEGDVVVTAVRFVAVGKESGVRVDLPFAHVFRFDGDLVTHYASHGTVDEALADAGIDPASGASA
jgi:ketosteroid isomerase-like protein